jgi:hypothetical protein
MQRDLTEIKALAADLRERPKSGRTNNRLPTAY